MTHVITRDEDDINRVLNKAAQGFDGGTAYPGKSYEEGILDHHRWLTGQPEAEEPLDEIELEEDEDLDDEDDEDEDDEGDGDIPL